MSRVRIRTVKPDCWADEDIGDLSRDVRLLFIVLITFCDDDGRFRDIPAQIIGHGYPDDEDITPAMVRGWLDELEAAGLVVRYEVAGKRYVTLPNWHRHQKINRYTPSSLPPCPPRPGLVVVPRKLRTTSGGAHDDLTPNASPTHAELTTSSPQAPDDLTRNSRTEGKGREGSKEREIAAASVRSDIDALCALLADGILAHSPTASVAPDSSSWRDACRLLLDEDGRDVTAIERVIRWATADEFWRSTIVSPAKLRQHFGTLTLKMKVAPIRAAHAASVVDVCPGDSVAPEALAACERGVLALDEVWRIGVHAHGFEGATLVLGAYPNVVGDLTDRWASTFSEAAGCPVEFRACGAGTGAVAA